MKDRDLTRWNRAGLGKFRYVDGNAPVWLEKLRQELSLAFDPEDSQAADTLFRLGALGPAELQDECITDNDTEAQRSEKRIRRMNRLLKNYHGERGDWGWEIARSFARACHVLTEHIDAYANEGFLGTATQWDNVRKMVEMLGYSPAPPASASTRLALFAKPGVVEKVAAGIQAKYSPPEGGDAIVFETLEELYVDSALNELRLVDWNVNQQSLESDSDLCFESGDAELSSGQWGILVHRQGSVESALPCQAGKIKDTTVSLQSLPEGSRSWKKGEVEFLAGAKGMRRLRLHDVGVVSFDRPHGLSIGHSIAWQNADKDWVFGLVDETDERSVRVSGGMPDVGMPVYPVVRIGRNKSNKLLYSLGIKNMPVGKKNSGKVDTPNIKTYKVDASGNEDTNNGIETAFKVTDDIGEVFLVNGFDKMIGIVAGAPDDYVLDGDAGGLRSGHWVLAKVGSEMKALRIDSLMASDDKSTILTFKDSDKHVVSERITSIVGPFKNILRPVNAHVNAELIPCDGEAVMGLKIKQPDEQPVSLHLTPGRRIIIEQVVGEICSHAFEATVQSYESGTLSFSPALQASDGFTFYNTVIRGNAAAAGHGAQQEENVLGSGDATLSGQCFVLSVQDVSFVADSTMTTGVAAAIDVMVAGRVWEQVSSLNDSGPEEGHYVVRMTEDRFISIQFGDGNRGRRLPSGTNNVHVRYRQGTGSKGNIAARSLAVLAKPHRFVQGVSQPIPALLGNDMEDMASLRDQASAGLLTLGRAVSVADFSGLASGHSSIWQARSYVGVQERDRRNSVHVTLVPAYGTALGGLKGEIQAYLQAHAVPGTRVVVHDFSPRHLYMKLTVYVKSDAFAPGLVMDQVRAEVQSAFSLKRRKLGQSVYLSEIFEIVEAVRGVEYSRCTMGLSMDQIKQQQEGHRAQEIPAADDEVIFVDTLQSTLQIDYEEYEL